MPMTEQQLSVFLRQPLVAVLGTVDEAGLPRQAPIWFHWEDGAAFMFTSRTTLKWRNLMENPYASLCIDWREPPYMSVIMDGPVEEVERSLYDLVLSMSLRYYGLEKGQEFAENYRKPKPDNVIFRLTPKRTASFMSD